LLLADPFDFVFNTPVRLPLRDVDDFDAYLVADAVLLLVVAGNQLAQLLRFSERCQVGVFLGYIVATNFKNALNTV